MQETGLRDLLGILMARMGRFDFCQMLDFFGSRELIVIFFTCF